MVTAVGTWALWQRALQGPAFAHLKWFSFVKQLWLAKAFCTGAVHGGNAGNTVPSFTGTSVKSPTDWDYPCAKRLHVRERLNLTFSTEIVPAMLRCTVASRSSLLGLHLRSSKETVFNLLPQNLLNVNAY